MFIFGRDQPILSQQQPKSKVAVGYTVRYAIGILLRYFPDSSFDEKHLNAVASVASDEYYIKMMQSRYFATALAKQYKKALPYISEKKLDSWVNRTTIQKACESFRASEEHKQELRNLKAF